MGDPLIPNAAQADDVEWIAHVKGRFVETKVVSPDEAILGLGVTDTPRQFPQGMVHRAPAVLQSGATSTLPAKPARPCVVGANERLIRAKSGLGALPSG